MQLDDFASLGLVVLLSVVVGCAGQGILVTDDTDADTDTDTDADTDPVPPAFLDLYAQDHLPAFELTISPACAAALDAEPFEYCPGTFTYRPTPNPQDDVVVNAVGIRLKGRASFRPLDDKPSFKIKFDEYIDGRRFMDLRRLTLNNMVQDPSMVRERLGYTVFRAMGLPAPACNHALVYVNGAYYGVYANLQTLDDEFVEWLYDPAPGNLYDTSNDEYFVDLTTDWLPWFELETNQDVGQTYDLEYLIAMVNGPSETFVSDAGAALDWDEWLGVGAVQAMIADWDGYFGATNNYKLYHELAADRFLLFPWGIDQTFGIQDGGFTQLRYAIDGSSSNRPNGLVFSRCKQVPACWDMYVAKVQEARAVWDALDLAGDLEAIVDQVGAHIDADERKPYSDAAQVRSLDDVRTFLDQRSALVAAQLP